MIVWINGSFGAGKSSTAAELAAMWPGSIVFDPEVLGVVLRAWTPKEAIIRDFQRIALWRDLVATTCVGLVAEWGRPVIVPMTLLRPAYFEQIMDRLRQSGQVVHHFCLTAPVPVLRERCRIREAGGDLSWLEERWAEYDAFHGMFANHLDTTAGTPRDMARVIAAQLPQPLPQTVGAARWTEWSP